VISAHSATQFWKLTRLAIAEAIDAGTLRGYAVDGVFPLMGRDERADRQIAGRRILQPGTPPGILKK
jgi:hypothetical protein